MKPAKVNREEQVLVENRQGRSRYPIWLVWISIKNIMGKKLPFSWRIAMLKIIVSLVGWCWSLGAWAQTLPADTKASPETKNLYVNLQDLSRKGIMFGHQDDLAYGIGWQYQPGRSDVKEVVGEYPAVFGWDIGHLELGSAVNLDSVPFVKMRQYMQQVYRQGGVNTVSWHLNNPLDATKTSWDKVDATISRLFADRKALKRYDAWLDQVAGFMKSLQGEKGEPIPVVLRLFHEHSGSWFWWGRAHCSPADYIKLWRYTVHYLRDKKKVHNLLYAYSPDRFRSRQDYLERYPGDAYVDVVGFDLYHRPESDPDNTFVADARQMVETLRQIGQEKKKVWAFTETGQAQLPFANWWTGFLWPVIKDAGLSYVMVWRNGRPDHYYAPYVEQASADNFKLFFNQPQVLFEKKLAQENIYQPRRQ
jgi:mannan endo-1,4-beta-mannosidase